jgi:hypothetical protein
MRGIVPAAGYGGCAVETKSLGGKYELYLLHNPYNFISRVTGVTPAGA